MPSKKTSQEPGVGAASIEMAVGRSPKAEGSTTVDRAREGDAEAFEELYRENAGRVYAICLRMTGNASEAEDLAQEAFVRAWQKLGSFRGDSSFSTWLHRLTVNLVLSDRRSQSRRAKYVTIPDDLTRFEKKTPGPAPHVSLDLEQAIATLPEGARKVFVLHDVEGYRHTEIAEMMGIATGTTKAQLHRARKLLREVLK